MRKYLTALLLILFSLAASAQAEPMRVLWWDVIPNESGVGPEMRREIVGYLNRLDGGQTYTVTYEYGSRGGAFAQHMAQNGGYKMLVFTAANTRRVFNAQDLEALRAFYATSSKALMLDGTLAIRNTSIRGTVRWPGVNNSSANLMQNQMAALRQTGGGLLIGTDHDVYQVPANYLLSALLPEASFRRKTNPSRDGDFFGDLLLAAVEPVKPIDVLRHWEAIPSQGQTPVGRFTDFLGAPVTLYTLVEASDKPGGGTRRPYISATIDPGDERVNISEEAAPVINRMPTRKSLPSN